jgi:hypothetical protein
MHRYDVLVRYMENNRHQIDCPLSLRAVSVPDMLYGIHISTNEQVWNTIAAGVKDLGVAQRQTLEVTLQTQEVTLQIQESVSQSRELAVRDFTRQFNTLMKFIEAECPNMFFLMPGARGWNPRRWANRPYQLYLICQYPPEPHPVGDGYRILQSNEWWITLSPWLNRLITLLKVGVPIVGAGAAVVTEAATAPREVDIKLLDTLAGDLSKRPVESSFLDRSKEPELARIR